MPPTRTLDDRIDRLYQLPLDEFTEARNALAKEVAAEKGDAADIKKLPKPPAAAWAINQVHWSRRSTFDAFLASAAALRKAHADVLAGKRADLRAAGTAHEESLEAVLKAALSVLAEAGNPATDATKQAIATTLRALPGAEVRPGRLANVLQPRGFEMLAGMPTAAPVPRPSATRPAVEPTPRAAKAEPRDRTAERAKAIANAKDALADATKAEKAAAQVVKREEFEAAKSARDVERAEARLADARAALDEAQQALEDAEQEVAEARKNRDAIARRVREASDTLARAHVKTQSAHAEVNRAEKL